MTRLSVAEPRLSKGSGQGSGTNDQRSLLRFRRFRVLFGMMSFFFGRHRGLESADAFAQAFAQFREFLRPKYQKGYAGYHQQVHRLKEAFEHEYSLVSRRDP